MFSQIDALLALARHGTMNAAAVSLRLTQSAISKRIGQLEDQLGRQLVKREGRGTVLTREGQAFVAEVSPLMADFHSLLTRQQEEEDEHISIAVSEAILSSWGAPLLVALRDSQPGLVLDIHTHRSPTIVDKVQAGLYPYGLCAGRLSATTGLVVEPIIEESMVLLACRGDLPRLLAERGQLTTLPVLCIEKKSNTWQGLSAKARALNIEPRWPVESSFAAARLALAGWGHALVPKGVAAAMQALPACLDLGPEGLSRPASLVCRKQVYKTTSARNLIDNLRRLSSTYSQGVS